MLNDSNVGNPPQKINHYAFWSNEHDALIATLWMVDQLSSRDIGKKLGKTKNAVIGRLNRLGLIGLDQQISVTPTPDLFPERGRCVYAFGDPGTSDFRFCGRIGYPWCPKHRELLMIKVRDDVSH
jgi:hypothetical protein